MGAAGVGATIYFGSEESKRQIQEMTEMFQQAHELGMFTVLWCYLRNSAFKTKDVGLSPGRRSDRAGEPPRRDDRGGHHQAEAAGNNGGFDALKFGKTHKAVYSQAVSNNPIDLTRYQLANCYMGRAG